MRNASPEFDRIELEAACSSRAGEGIRTHDLLITNQGGVVVAHVERIEFSPRVISIDGDVFIEEFGVTGILASGRCLESQWAEILTYRDDLGTSLRLYFNPIDFSPALGIIGRAVGPAAVRLARRGLEPYEPIHHPE